MINLLFKSPENTPFNVRYTVVEDGTPQKIAVVDQRLKNLQILGYLSNIEYTRSAVDFDNILEGFSSDKDSFNYPKY
jgi:hypothetical protein